MRPGAIAATLAVNVALAAGLAYLWSDGERSRWIEPTALPPSLEEALAMPASEPVDVSRYRETVERPLFAANRKVAPRADPGSDAQAVDALKDVRLLGTYGVGERGGIIVLSGGKVQRVPVGETIGGWKVAGGEGRSAALVRADGERRQLELVLNNVAPAAPAAAARAGGQDAAKAAVADQVRPPDGAQSATSRGASAEGAGGTGALSREDRRRQGLDRINARRAARGLPPMPENR